MDEPMKSMKLVREDAEKKETESLMSAQPSYPYGLCLYIEPAIYKKLNMMKAPELGQTLALHAIVEVAGVNMENSVTGSKDISMRLQITDMILKDKQEKKPAEKALYNDKE